MIALKELTAYLDDLLQIREVPDWKQAHNGLQVEGRARVRRIACAVDSSMQVLEAAREQEADLLLVHHGLYWQNIVPLTGINYRKAALLINAQMAVYSAHLPLDVHPEFGNNAVLARRLNLPATGVWGEKEGWPVGVWCQAERNRDDLLSQIRSELGVQPILAPGGPEHTQRIGVLTGAGADWLPQAAAAGLDTLITGEGPHHTYLQAEEMGINLIYAGHYATETVGVEALGKHLQARFGLEYCFLPHPTGL